MRLGRVRAPGAGPLAAPPVWPPLLATRGPGAKSAAHAHHGMHVIVAVAGELRVRVGGGGWRRTAGVVTAPDVPHAVDGSGAADVLLVFLEPESDAGASLLAALDGPFRLLDARAAAALAADADPLAIMQADGVAWTRRAALRAMTTGDDTSLEALAAAAGLSPGRLMHAFTESIGVPLRPYLAWLKLQRAAAAIAGGAALSDAAAAAGFADAAHMSRTFRRMLGTPPSALRAQMAAS